MVTRADGKGGVMRPPSEALTLDQAIRTYTEYGAWSPFHHHDRGSLTVDRLGDLAVFEHDPFELPVDALPAVEADLTVVGGRVVYDRTTQVTQMDAVQATSITSQAS
jgi:predicted amidohydrolase YtcJ